MTDDNLIPVYSYNKFKELADDRMLQVKIFVQTKDFWEPSGFGTIHFFQINHLLLLKELNFLSDYDPFQKNLFVLIESVDFQNLPLIELNNLRIFHTVLNSKSLKINNVIVFYDMYLAKDFEYDIESYLIREGHQLDS